MNLKNALILSLINAFHCEMSDAQTGQDPKTKIQDPNLVCGYSETSIFIFSHTRSQAWYLPVIIHADSSVQKIKKSEMNGSMAFEYRICEEDRNKIPTPQAPNGSIQVQFQVDQYLQTQTFAFKIQPNGKLKMFFREDDQWKGIPCQWL